MAHLCWDDLQQRQLVHQLLGRLPRQLAGVMVPGRALQVEPAHVAAVPAYQWSHRKMGVLNIRWKGRCL